MSGTTEYTKTELIKLIDDVKKKHDKLKQDIINDTYLIDDLQNLVKNKINKLDALEKNYVELVEKLYE